jgi:hypothetical protein
MLHRALPTPMTGLETAEQSEEDPDDSGLPMSGMGSINFPAFRSVTSAPSKARPCRPGAGPGSGSLGQAPDTECCVAEGNDGCEAYTGS